MEAKLRRCKGIESSGYIEEEFLKFCKRERGFAHTAALFCVPAGPYRRGEKDQQMECLAQDNIDSTYIPRIRIFQPLNHQVCTLPS